MTATELRGELRAWLEANCPPSMRTWMPMEEQPLGGTHGRWPNPDTKVWLDRCAARGLTVPTLPVEYGGAGYSGADAAIWYEELRRIGGRLPLMGNAVETMAPVLLAFGTEAQRREHLPRIARGEVQWAQGFSEPDAGSDLASLRSRAVRDGDRYVVTGQKLWSSYAHHSDWMFCLVRTDPQAPIPQKGISMLLVDLRSPGVTIRPIDLISGDSEFCEVFFDDVSVPVANLLGRENEGWSIAKYLLSQEREGYGDRNLATVDVPLVDLWLASGSADDDLRRAVAANELDELAINLTVARIRRQAAEGTETEPLMNVVKYVSSEHKMRRHELAALVTGWNGAGWDGDLFSDEERAATRAWLFSRAYAIGGGTSEIQLNIIAKRDLRLPSGAGR